MILDNTCGCEDFPCCGHGSKPLSQQEEKQMYEDTQERNLISCEGPNDMSQQVCKEADCDEYNECWSESK